MARPYAQLPHGRIHASRRPTTLAPVHSDESADPVSGPDTAPGSSDAEFLASVQRRADAGVEKRKAEIQALRQQSKELQAIASMVDAVAGALQAGRPASALAEVERAKGAREALATHNPEAAQDLTRRIAEWEGAVDLALQGTANTFPAALAALGLEPDRSSRDPKYTLSDNFITIQFDKKKRVATVQTRGGKKEKVPPDPEVVAARAADEHARCFDRSVDLADVAKRLRQAYEACAGPTRLGGPVPVLDIADQMKSDDPDFALDEFMVDLARLVTSGPHHIHEAHSLWLDHTKQPGSGLLLPGLESRGYYGYVRFSGKDEGGQSGDRGAD